MVDTVNLQIQVQPAESVPTPAAPLTEDQGIFTPDDSVAKNSYIAAPVGGGTEIAVPVNLDDGDVHGIIIQGGPHPPSLSKLTAELGVAITLAATANIVDVLQVKRYGTYYLIVEHNAFELTPSPPPVTTVHQPADPADMELVAEYVGADALAANPNWIDDWRLTQMGQNRGGQSPGNLIVTIPGSTNRLWCTTNQMVPDLIAGGLWYWDKKSTDPNGHGQLMLDGQGSPHMNPDDERYFLRGKNYAMEVEQNVMSADWSHEPGWANMGQIYTKDATGFNRQTLAIFIDFNGPDGNTPVFWGEVRGGKNGQPRKWYTPIDDRIPVPSSFPFLLRMRWEFRLQTDGTGYAMLFVDVSGNPNPIWQPLLVHNGDTGSDLILASPAYVANHTMGFYSGADMEGTIDKLRIYADAPSPTVWEPLEVEVAP